jgi:hypothetical protein
MPAFHQIESVSKHRQRPVPQQIYLDETRPLCILFVPGDNRITSDRSAPDRIWTGMAAPVVLGAFGIRAAGQGA